MTTSARIGAAAFTLVLVGILISGCVFSSAPAEATAPRFTVIKSHGGVVVVWNEAPAHFILEFPGDRFAPLTQLPGASFSADGRVVQTFTVRIDHFSEGPSCERDVLRCYEDWEVAHRRSMFGAAVGARDLVSPAPCFAAWEADVPEEVAGSADRSVTKQVYATRVVEHLVLVLPGSETTADPPGSVEAYLASVSTSLRVYDQPLDVEAIRRDLAAGRPLPSALP